VAGAGPRETNVKLAQRRIPILHGPDPRSLAISGGQTASSRLRSRFVNPERTTMSRSQMALRPHDVCVALQLVLTPSFSYRELAQYVGLSLGETHNSVKRLEEARLFMAAAGGVNVPALLELLVHGVPYVFPGRLGPDIQGVPTAHSGPALAERLSGVDVIVWPSANGGIRGQALVPLCASAPDLAQRNPVLYRWLTLVDALRVGRARDRSLATDILRHELSDPRSDD